MKDHRRIIDGERVPYTCENTGFLTDVGRGERHGGASRARGSVTPEPLVQNDRFSLWLEHVESKKDHNAHNLYWLMWYEDGMPTIPASGVFSDSQLKNIVELLSAQAG